MKLPKARRWFASVAMLLITLLTATGCTEKMIVLNPKGPIAEQQRDLMFISLVLTCVVIVPVLILFAVIAWRYRDRKGRTSKYTPNWEHSTKLEVIWWGIPIIIITILAVITEVHLCAGTIQAASIRRKTADHPGDIAGLEMVVPISGARHCDDQRIENSRGCSGPIRDHGRLSDELVLDSAARRANVRDVRNGDEAAPASR